MGRFSKNSRVTLVELSPKRKNVFSKFKIPRALPLLTGILKKDGWTDVEMFSDSFHRGEIRDSDIVGISTLTGTLPQSYQLADDIRRSSPDTKIVFGGLGASYLVEESLRHGDIVVTGEGDRTIKTLFDRLVYAEEDLEDIKGIAFNKNGEIIDNGFAPLLSLEEMAELPLPYYDAETMAGMTIGPVGQQRGCPYNCNFCLVTQTFGRKVRYFPNERTTAGLKQLRDPRMGQTAFLIGDNAGANPPRAIDLFETIKEAGQYKDGRTAQVSVAAAKNPELMKAMRSAGVRHLCVGFESTNNDSLVGANKPFSLEDNTAAAKTFREEGFYIHAMMMIGFDTDTRESGRELLEWTKKHSDSAQFFILTPLPGTPFYEQMKKDGRICSDDWGKWDAQHDVLLHDNFYPGELHGIASGMYREYYSPKECIKRVTRSKDPLASLVLGGYAVFKGLDGLKNL